MKTKLKKPILSVCLITYNQEKYIKDALDGILAQQTSFEYELIIHDDASTDGTIEILKQYEEKYKNIIKLIIESENKFSKTGFSFFIDMLALSGGTYIALCEGDDYWTDPLKLEKQVAILEGNLTYSMSIHNALRLHCLTGEESLFNKTPLWKELDVSDVLLRGWFAPTASFVFRKNNVNIPSIAKINMDIVILYQNATRGKIHYSEDVSSVYRYSSLNSLSEKYKNNRIGLYRKKLNFLNYVDNHSYGKYIFYTSLARLKLFASAILFFISFK